MKRSFNVLLAIIFACSCSSEDNSAELQTDNFYALTLGNSWEYKYYLKDMSTNEFLPTPVTESVEITETIVIDNKIYYNFRHIITGNDGNYVILPDNSEKNYKLRDSLGFLIDNIGSIKYSNNTYDEYFVDELSEDLSYYLRLFDIDVNISTNAENFSCYDNHFYLKDVNGSVSNSLDHIYREDGKGEVLSTMSFASQSEPFAEKRLELYSLQ